MFEDTTPPTNLPIAPTPSAPPAPAKEPEDMFAKVESAQTPPSPPPMAEPSSPSGRGENIAPSAPAEIKPPLIASKKVIVVAGVILGILVVAGIAYGVLKFVRKAALPPSVPPASQDTVAPPVENSVPPAPAEPLPELPPSLPPVSGETPAQTTQTNGAVGDLSPGTGSGEASGQSSVAVDTDGDGLTDAEEAKIGTDPTKPDSDNDGLLDGEEVHTYGTDPLNPDTDGDKYLDGQEVKGGYNPKGPGKMFSVPAQP